MVCGVFFFFFGGGGEIGVSVLVLVIYFWAFCVVRDGMG